MLSLCKYILINYKSIFKDIGNNNSQNSYFILLSNYCNLIIPKPDFVQNLPTLVETFLKLKPKTKHILIIDITRILRIERQLRKMTVVQKTLKTSDITIAFYVF